MRMLVASLTVLAAGFLASGCGVLQGTKLAPVAVIEVIPQKGHLPFEVHLSGVSSHDVYTSVQSYAWDLGDGTTDTQDIVVHKYARPGAYVVVLTVTNGFGLSNTARATVIVDDRLGPVPPDGLVAEADAPRQITLNWRDASSDEDGFLIERKLPADPYAVVAMVGTDIHTYVDTGLQPDTRYCYRVRAFNDAANSPYANEACAATAAGGGPVGDQTDAGENDLVAVTRAITSQGEELSVVVQVQAKVALELAAVVDKLDGLVLATGELSSFAVNLQPGDTLTIAYTLTDAGDPGGTITGTVRAKPPDGDSVSLDLVSSLAP